TAAATAPSTNGASDSRTDARRSGSSRSSAISAESSALPRSIRTSTPSEDHTSSIAARTRVASVPIAPSPSSPPAVPIATSAPPVSRARRAVPSARAELCDTRTSPTTARPPSGSGRERPDQDVAVREGEQPERHEPDVDPPRHTRRGVQVEQHPAEPEHRVDRDEQQEQGLDR